MKLWRKQAKKTPSGEFNSITNVHTGEVLAKEQVMKRNGREIRYQNYMGELFSKKMARTYPLLDKLFERGNIKFVMSKKELETLKQLEAKAQKLEDEANETK